MMRVEMRGIEVSYGAVQALGGVSLLVEPGRSSVLVGPNGAGKSTLMGVLLGLVRPGAGQVLAEGQAGPCLPRRLRSRLGYLPERAAFAESLSGRDVLRFFTRARGLPISAAAEALARVGLAGAAGRAVRGYSRGMRQRLGLAVAILGEPDLLVLDEPTSGLDQEGLAILWEIMDRRRQLGLGMIVSTHDLVLIERHADEITVLDGGLVRAHGSPEDLRRQAGLPVRVSLELGDDAAAASLLARLRAAGLGGACVRDGVLRVAVPPERLLDLVREVDRHASKPRHLRVVEPGLDDVYERLLREAS